MRVQKKYMHKKRKPLSAATRLEEEVGVWLVYNIVIGTLVQNFRIL